MTGKRGRPPGLPKTGGKPKGYSVKAAQIRKSLKERLEIAGLDVVAEYAKLLNDPDLSQASRIRILETLLAYSEPRLKEIESPAPTADTPASDASDEPTDSLLAIVQPTPK